ncbi:aminotransferase class V-fold PLP-dependent enzyme [Membranihabitans maritimus]|uniref:aminotransferase class V-fold PLP-dependent enzyme n=1 Tax=Membranihabitans maritimus TaxID=2904244 RepID=UPI001F27205C|nr:cysteine desulfurase [Membranihabitans maritimus]
MITQEQKEITKLDVNKIRIDFPILNTNIYGHSLVYFDNAATTQKPNQVIDSISDYYKNYNSNVHRGVHHLSQMATDRFEEARRTVRDFINAESEKEIIFTRGTSDSINLIASSFGKAFVRKGDRVLITAMEHHSNIVPWQILCEDREAQLDVIPIDEKGELIFEEFEKLLDSDVRILALPYVSNSLGTVNPVKKIIEAAHSHGVPVLLDAAQAVQHIPVDVKELNVDFLAFSSHKIYGPTGMGILYGKEEWLEKIPPYQGGGEMIHTVTFEKTTYNELPFKFEAGTPNIAGAIGLDSALKYVTNLGIDSIHIYENKLYQYALEKLSSIKELTFIGEAKERAGAISFVIENTHPFDVGEILDKQGIAVRTGHHCTEPIMDQFKIPGTIRASFSFYNTKDEVDRLVLGLNRAKQMLL